MMFYLSCLLILLFTANAERVQMEPTHRQTLVEDWMDMGAYERPISFLFHSLLIIYIYIYNKLLLLCL